MRGSKRKNGIVSLAILLFISAIGLVLASSAALIALTSQQIVQTSLRSMQSYYASEAGLEDATYRIKNALSYPSSYTLSVGSSQASIVISPQGNIRTVQSQGQFQQTVRKLQTDLALSTQNVQFYYGIQVGAGGIEMGNNSSIVGNVFSNGNIRGSGNPPSTITGSAQAAGGSSIQTMRINADARANSLSDCVVGGRASYVTTLSNCSAGSTQIVSQGLSPQSFPITQSQIDIWKAQATGGGTLSGYTLGNGASATLGPKKINGDMSLGNGVTLTLSGTVWVTGTINFGNNDIIRLHSSYGSNSGALLVDGSATIGNGANLQGSGQTNSYLMLLSTYGPGDAIQLGNSNNGAIFYAPNGTVQIGNTLTLYQVTGYGLEIGNGTTITYQSGLANVNFSSGPGGSFQILDWNEI